MTKSKIENILLNIILWPIIVLLVCFVIKVGFLMPSQEDWSMEAEDMERIEF